MADMVPFKPSEIRIIAALLVLALAGSVVTLLQRQGHISRLNIGAISGKSIYNYRYTPKDLASTSLGISSARMDSLANLPEARPAGERIDLNRSGYYDLEALPGIGPVLAERIMSYRDSVGGFKSVDDLKEVKGIGPSKFTLLKDKVVVK